MLTDPDTPGAAETDAHTHGRPGAVFVASVAVIVAIIVWSILATDSLATAVGKAQTWVTGSLGWVYLVVPLALIGVLAYLALSKFGSVRLGSQDSRPEFRTYSWLAMILSAVMGIGLINYGVAEPISHLMDPPHGLAAPSTQDAAVTALQFSYFDWGLHAWAIFGVFGLAIAYSTHRKGRRGLVSPMLRPLFGDAMDGPLGKAVDVFAIIATLFGTTTSLGLGASQIDAGIARVFDTGTGGTGTQIAIIAVVTLLFTASALTGVGNGIRYISEITMGLSAVLLAYVLFAGPTDFITNTFVHATGRYGSNFLEMSLTTPATPADLSWMGWWTYFMMAWWISWGAFVGVFLAKISRGRTIREFVLGVTLVPSAVFFVWFTVFGGTAMHADLTERAGIGAAAAEDMNSAFFNMLETVPLSGITSVLVILLVVLFFVSGADANTYVLSMLSSDGNLYPSRPVLTLWGALTGATAVVLLLAGGLGALQSAAILSAFPFTFVIVLLTVSLMRELRQDPEFKPLTTNPLDDPSLPSHRRVTYGESRAAERRIMQPQHTRTYATERPKEDSR